MTGRRLLGEPLEDQREDCHACHCTSDQGACNLHGVGTELRDLRDTALPTPCEQVDAVRKFGGEFVEVIMHGDSFDIAQLESARICHAESRTLVHPFDDPLVIAGQVWCRTQSSLPQCEACPGALGCMPSAHASWSVHAWDESCAERCGAQGTIAAEVLKIMNNQRLDAIFCCVVMLFSSSHQHGSTQRTPSALTPAALLRRVHRHIDVAGSRCSAARLNMAAVSLASESRGCIAHDSGGLLARLASTPYVVCWILYPRR
jgi:hypothetical protein